LPGLLQCSNMRVVCHTVIIKANFSQILTESRLRTG
jgi:hypothetical protein